MGEKLKVIHDNHHLFFPAVIKWFLWLGPVEESDSSLNEWDAESLSRGGRKKEKEWRKQQGERETDRYSVTVPGYCRRRDRPGPIKLLAQGLNLVCLPRIASVAFIKLWAQPRQHHQPLARDVPLQAQKQITSIDPRRVLPVRRMCVRRDAHIRSLTSALIL